MYSRWNLHEAHISKESKSIQVVYKRYTRRKKRASASRVKFQEEILTQMLSKCYYIRGDFI